MYVLKGATSHILGQKLNKMIEIESLFLSHTRSHTITPLTMRVHTFRSSLSFPGDVCASCMGTCIPYLAWVLFPINTQRSGHNILRMSKYKFTGGKGGGSCQLSQTTLITTGFFIKANFIRTELRFRSSNLKKHKTLWLPKFSGWKVLKRYIENGLNSLVKENVVEWSSGIK